MKPTSRTLACECDTVKIKSIILNKEFDNIPRFDTVPYSQQNFDSLPDTTKSVLWYRDIENATPTQFTKFWSSGRFMRVKTFDTPTKDVSGESAFFDKYYNRKNIELAFEFGPNMDLGAYHYFIVSKVENCFLITHSYYRHARFTFKSYAIIDVQQLNSLYGHLEKINRENFIGQTGIGYAGYFVDNRNKEKFFVDFDKEKDVNKASDNYTKEVQEVFDFLDKKIDWIVTYQL